ncbi:MAG: hypothetical protein HYY20_09090 [Candidatus Tectomicrobia bacterium]|uniref:Addiction module toxin RelE n=1 Tax=Tectimicrobiota bacterium TaxID=2528274 RepID=A0A932CPP3_UNCTE|nr:hypothetical protein [Candidatus Tectomicrobia bacterium]
MSDEEREAFIVYIACNPEAGEIMPELPLFLLTVFAKSEQANLSQQERNDLKRLTAILVKEYQTRKRE